jgi:hypothetical protein
MTFEEISDLIGGDMSFDSDAYLSLTAKLHGALLSYDDGNIEASLYADQGSQSDKMTIEAALKHRQNPSSTTLGMKMDATGHILKYDSTGIGYGKVPFEGKDLHVISSDPVYSIDGLDIDAVMSIIDRAGSIEVQDILDNCDGVALAASWARVDWDSDGVADALIDDCSAELNKGVGGTSMATMTMAEAEVDLPVDNADVYIHALSTEVSFRCDIPFSELVDLILNELDFTEDTDLDLSVTSGDLKMVVTTDDSTVELEMVNESADEDAVIALDLGIVYAEQKGRADLNGSLSALGFTTDVTVKSNDDDSGLIAIIIDLSLEMDDFDIVSAYRIIKETGTITMQQLLDCSDMLSLAATQTSIYNQSDASEEVNITGLQAVLSKNPKGQNTMTLGFDGLTTFVSKDDWVVGIFSGTSEILMVSDGSLTECVEVFTKGVAFTDDTSAEIKLSNESIRIEYTKDKDSVILTNERLTNSSPRFATATMSLDYAEYDKSTKLAVSISSIGHKITISDTSYVTKSDSNLHLTVSTEEVSGSLDVVFKDIVEFSANLSMPCEIRLEYTDVELEVDTSEAIISLTHGELDVDDYDYTEQGMFALIPSIKDSDFDLTTRLLMSAGSLIVYNSDHTAIVNSYGDAEVEVKKIAAEVKRNDSLSVTLDRLKLTTTDKSGKVNERDVDHLDILKDDTGTVPEKNWVERNSLYLALAFIAISIGMIVFLAHYHGKHPHKFRFKE